MKKDNSQEDNSQEDKSQEDNSQEKYDEHADSFLQKVIDSKYSHWLIAGYTLFWYFFGHYSHWFF